MTSQNSANTSTVTLESQLDKLSKTLTTRRAEQRQQMILPAPLRALKNYEPENEAKLLPEILVLIAEVENAKQIHISNAERITLANELLKLGEPIAKLRQRGESVKRNKDYGRISLDVWLSAEPLYTVNEAWKMVLERIEERKRRLRAVRIDEAKLEEAGLVELQEALTRQLEDHKERIRGRIKARIKRARAFVLGVDETIKHEIKSLAENRGLLKDDPFWRDSLPFLVAHLLEDIEAIMRRFPHSDQRRMK